MTELQWNLSRKLPWETKYSLVTYYLSIENFMTWSLWNVKFILKLCKYKYDANCKYKVKL